MTVRLKPVITKYASHRIPIDLILQSEPLILLKQKHIVQFVGQWWIQDFLKEGVDSQGGYVS